MNFSHHRLTNRKCYDVMCVYHMYMCVYVMCYLSLQISLPSLSSLFFHYFLENVVTVETLSMDGTHKLANINNLTYSRLLQQTFSDFSEFCFPKRFVRPLY